MRCYYNFVMPPKKEIRKEKKNLIMKNKPNSSLKMLSKNNNHRNPRKPSLNSSTRVQTPTKHPLKHKLIFGSMEVVSLPTNFSFHPGMSTE